MNLLRSLWSSSAAGSGSGSPAVAASASAEKQIGGARQKAPPAAATWTTASTSSSLKKKSNHRHRRVVARSSSTENDNTPDHHVDLESRARALRTPHSGYHFDGSPRRFFEGWYFKVTLPGEAQAFALIYSIEDPGSVCSSSSPPSSSDGDKKSSSSKTNVRNLSGGKPGLGVQIMGPDDSYLIQYDDDVTKFWAKDPELALGACFEAKTDGNAGNAAGNAVGIDGPVSPRAFDDAVSLGFQATSTWHQGSIVSRELGASGSLHSTVPAAKWAFRVEPVVGWGGNDDGENVTNNDDGDGPGDDDDDDGEEEDPLDHVDEDDHEIPERGPSDSFSASSSPSKRQKEKKRQKATAGWLAALPVFEPHWQVLMAKGRATGWIEWGDKRYEFEGAPAYAEKNWGGSFPSKWWWVQCDALEVSRKGGNGDGGGGKGGEDNTAADGGDGSETAAVTAVGAIRSLPGSSLLPWLAKEDVGMIGLHHGGRFYEFVPWKGSVSWDVAPWGDWRCRASTKEHEVELEATCGGRGTPLRAPTESRGLAVLCRDSFAGKLTIRLYKKGTKGEGGRELVVELSSDRAAVETGGGPWGENWSAPAAMKQPFRSLVKAPIDPERVSGLLPSRWRPRGL